MSVLAVLSLLSALCGISTTLTTAPAAAVNANQFAWPATGHTDANDVAWHRANENGARAVDIQAVTGTDVKAAQSGKVVVASHGCANSNSWGCGGGYGNYVIVRHDRVGVSQPLYTLYAHLNSALSVAVNANVNTGDKLGDIAMSGSTYGPHTHFAIGSCQALWSTGPGDYNTNCTKWSGADTANATVTAEAPVPGVYTQLVAVPSDADDDGVSDNKDVAPYLAGVANNRGYPLYNRVASGDFNGDGYGDMAVLYGYDGSQTKLWVFYGTPEGRLAPPLMEWDSGVGKWNPSRIKVAATDMDGNGKDDIVVFYGYDDAQTKLWVFYGTPTGPNAPLMEWSSAIGGWNWSNIHPLAGDFNGDGYGDAAALYRYPDSQTKLWVFYGTPTGPNAPLMEWSSAIGGWNADRTKASSIDINQDGTQDIVVFYGYPDSQTKLWVFYGTPTGPNAPLMEWDSGVGVWNWARIHPTTGDFNGDGHGDVAAIYGYDGSQTKLWVFYGSSSGSLTSPRLEWSSSVGGWNWGRVMTPKVSIDVNRTGADEINVLYGYDGSRTKLWSFYGTSTGPNPPSMKWDSGVGIWNWNRM